jgi:hypothetical protein
MSRLGPRARGALSLVVEAVILVAAYLAYEAVRRFVTPEPGEAIGRALGLIRVEQRMGIFFEPHLQQRVLAHDWLVTFLNWVYVWGYLPVISACAVYLYIRHRETYGRYRNAFLLSGMIGLVIFSTLPVAPPRMFPDFGFVDTVRNGSYAYRSVEGSDLINEFAAVPSFHFGWILLASVAIYRTHRQRVVRLIAVIAPLLMLSAILLTANHYLLDAFAGGATVMLALAVVCLGERCVAAWSARHRPSVAHA